MRPNVYLKRLLKVSISPDSSYSDIEIGLSTLTRIVRSTSRKEVVRGATKKMLGLFYSRDIATKTLALRHLSKVSRHVEEVDTNIVHMFYSTDERITDLGVRFVDVFSRFFCNNDVVFYYVYRSRSKYREKAMRALMRCSPRYLSYGGEMGVWDDLELFENIRTCVAEEYFGRLELSKLVELASMYPCLVKYFKFTDDFLREEMGKTERYGPVVINRLGRILGECGGEGTRWDDFLLCLKYMRRGKFERSLAILRDLQGLGIDSKYRAIFRVVVRKVSVFLGTDVGGNDGAKFVISTSFEAKLHGLGRNRVYRTLCKAFKEGIVSNSVQSTMLET